MNITSQAYKNLITAKAKELGFFKIGFAKYEVLENESDNLRKWLDDGKQADMAWIEKGFDKRKDIRNIMHEAKSVISLAFNYYTPNEHDETKPKISRYAWGKDYHKILKPKLKELSSFIFPPSGGLRGVRYVDDGPVMDKVWAQRAGIGWMGKHTNIINPEYGSWFFLCEIITNIDFEIYDTLIEDMCGSCTLCISACPTGAIVSEYVVDASKCISYQTIENRGDIPDEINLDGWIFGCDVCQDVCPFNSPKYNHDTVEVGFYPLKVTSPPTHPTAGAVLLKGEGREFQNISVQIKLNESSKEELQSITEEEFTIIFADSPINRTKYKGWKRNLGRF